MSENLRDWYLKSPLVHTLVWEFLFFSGLYLLFTGVSWLFAERIISAKTWFLLLTGYIAVWAITAIANDVKDAYLRHCLQNQQGKKHANT